MIRLKKFTKHEKLARRKAQTSSSQSGFTIIESLVAIIVVTILLVALAPVLALATAARVQARRIELATQAAKTYTDGVDAGSIFAPEHTVTINETSSNGSFQPQRENLKNAAVPTSLSANCPTNTYCSNTTTQSLYCVDIDGDNICTQNSPADLIVQGFRSVSPTVNQSKQGYLLGVRVYRAYAFNDSNALATQSDRGGKRSVFVGTLGDYKAPLIEITTEISTSETKFTDYCQRFGGCQ
ncbi:MAG TPA: prepilin-type cleavage/methylation domain-containing protein [Cyanobacteria bacterium UBA8803]|nr:prepilin-type cleavage/methylation domain-containing protein [Cyanobacteria bacterium UBA9273]HBL60227.1 prepilin-type cleavage/methylation domain-containing protein [Cyanobacteria bacterium UBA8803]